MSTRTVTVAVEVTQRYTAKHDIDEEEYLAWLDGAPDTDSAMREYLRSGDDFEVIGAIVQDANADGTTEVWNSEIVEVTP